MQSSLSHPLDPLSVVQCMDYHDIDHRTLLLLSCYIPLTTLLGTDIAHHGLLRPPHELRQEGRTEAEQRAAEGGTDAACEFRESP